MDWAKWTLDASCGGVAVLCFAHPQYTPARMGTLFTVGAFLGHLLIHVVKI